MRDLISRAAAIHVVNAYDYRGFTLDAVRKITDGCAERLRELPSIEAEPVRHGKWVWNNDGIDWNIGAWVCSECGGRNENIHAGKQGTVGGFGTNPYIWAGSQFCPNCGAKMSAKENER